MLSRPSTISLTGGVRCGGVTHYLCVAIQVSRDVFGFLLQRWKRRKSEPSCFTTVPENPRDGCSWFLHKLHQKTHELMWRFEWNQICLVHLEEAQYTKKSPPQTVMWTFLHSERNWTCRKCSVGCEVPSGGVLTQHEQTSGWTKLWVTEEFHTESQKRLPLCRRYLGIQTDNPALSSTQHWPVPAAAAPAGPPPTAGKLSGSSSSHWVTSGRPACIYYHLTTQCWWELLMLIH